MHAGHAKVEVNPLVTFFVPGGGVGGSHIVQEDADTQADGWPFRPFPRVPINSGNRNSAPGRGRRKSRSPLGLWTRLLLDPGCHEEAEFSCLGRAVRRGGVNPPTAVLSPHRCRVVHDGHIWCNQKHTLLVSLMLDQIHTSHTLTFKQVRHQG